MEICEQGAGRRRRTGHGGADPPEDGREEGECPARRGEPRADGHRLAREVHDVCERHDDGDGEDGELEVGDRLPQRRHPLAEGEGVFSAGAALSIDEGDDQPGQQEHRPRRGKPAERELCCLDGLPLGVYELTVEPRPAERHVRRFECLGHVDSRRPQLGDGENDDHEPVGQEPQGHARAAELFRGRLGQLFLRRSGAPRSQKEGDRGEGEQRRENRRQLVGKEVCGQDVAQPHGHAGRERGGPRLFHSAFAVEDAEEEHGDPAQEERGDAALGCADGVGGGVAELCGGGHRDGHRAEADVEGVAHHRHERRLDRGDAEGEQHGAGYRDRRAETREAFHEAAEAEADEERLNPHVALADGCEYPPDVFRASRFLRQIVEPHGHDDDVDDRKEAKGCALGRGKQREVDGHAEGEDCGSEGRRERNDRAHVRFHLEYAQKNEKDDERQKAEQRRQGERRSHRRRRRRVSGVDHGVSFLRGNLPLAVPPLVTV